jgi:hypothetical protein
MFLTFGTTRELRKFLTTQHKQPPVQILTTTTFSRRLGKVIQGKDGEIVAASIEPLERTKKVVNKKSNKTLKNLP